MVKYISAFGITLVLSVLLAGQALAHSVVVSSDPEDGSTVEGEVSIVSMTYDSSIQQEEEIYIEDADGERIDPEEVTIEDDTVEASLPDPLESGDYTIVWEVYGADGHLVDGEIEFTVDAEASGAEESEDSTETDEASAASNGAEEGGGMAISTIVTILLAAAVVIGIIIYMTRRRK